MKISLGTYEALVAAFRLAPGVYSRAAKAASTTRPTARNAWENGWEHDHAWAVPIKLKLEREALEARAARETATQRARLHDETTLRGASDDAVETRTRELQLVKATQGVAGIALGQAVAITRAAGPLSKRLVKALEVLADPDDPITNPKQILQILRDVGRLAKQGGELAELSMKLERLHAGHPGDVAGMGFASIDDAIDELKRLQEDHALWEASGGALRLVEPVPGK